MKTGVQSVRKASKTLDSGFRRNDAIKNRINFFTPSGREGWGENDLFRLYQFNKMKNSKPEVVILGAGPAGLGAAFQLTRNQLARVTVLEESDRVGGTAGSFELSGIRVDYGSHRLHPSCDPGILNDLQSLMGDNLLCRQRHGRIRLRGRWIHFPLKPFDLTLRLPPIFTVGVMRDLTIKLLGNKGNNREEESFASVLEAGLGRTICRDFYFPYASKIWGLPPEELSATQAHRRVSAGSLRKMFQKILSAFPGIGSAGKGRFFYPRGGFGQISQSLLEAAKKAGVAFHPDTRIKSIQMIGKIIKAVYCEQDGKLVSYPADYVWSTIPLPDLMRYLELSSPPSVVQASKKINYRAMILIYLVLEQEQFSKYDAHYFPESDIPITRLSEPKNYSNILEPHDLTVLCAELPCATTDAEWQMKDEELGRLVLRCLESADLKVISPVKEVITHRLCQAYPMYRRNYEVYFNEIDQWLSEIENLLTFGRQGLFVHDNTHHALSMAYCAAACLDENGCFDHQRWNAFRRVFDTHVVED